jgi:phosphoribosylamine-glycine ligase
MKILPEKSNKKARFVVVTSDWSGLGFAMLIKNAGYSVLMAYEPESSLEPDQKRSYELVGKGMVDRVTLGQFMRNRASFKDAYIIFDQNIHSEASELLKKEGFKVKGGSALSCKLEHDRNFATNLVKKAGLKTPPTFEFSDIQSGLDFLDNNEDKAFVFKPDDGSDGAYSTYVPDAVKPNKANRELYDYLSSEQGDSGTYILQERKDGVEVNIEYFLYNGQPFFAHANFECKRKSNSDENEMCGCAQDIDFVVPLKCKLGRETVLKLISIPEFQNYTGPVDMNVIVADNEYYFLEFCCREGYNSSPNLFINLALKSYPELIARWLDGDVNNFEEYFKFGFGATVTLRIDHPKSNYPFYIPKDMENKFYFFDQYKKQDKYYLAGFGEEVGVVCAHDYTIQQAGENVLEEADKINYPCHYCRTDIDKKDYISSPQLRYDALNSMKMFNVNI